MRIRLMAESADHNQPRPSEWSYQIKVDDIDATGRTYVISPDADQRRDLCRRLNIIDITVLTAELKVEREQKRIIKVTGDFSAHIIQECVKTLEPVSDHITEHFEAWHADPAQAISFARARHEKEKEAFAHERPMLEEHEDPEPIIDGKIDLGELVTQYLSLAIDPYPQSVSAASEAQDIPLPKEKPLNPFAALKDLKKT